MATVDLDALATALRAAGFAVEVDVVPYVNEKRLDCAGVTVSPAGRCWYENSVVIDWIALDIIRSAVSPSAPDGLRDRIVDAIKAVEHSELADRGYVDAIADAVLAVLPPAPRVDVDAVMALVKRYGDSLVGAQQSYSHGDMFGGDQRNNQAADDITAIRAMLEGTA